MKGVIRWIMITGLCLVGAITMVWMLVAPRATRMVEGHLSAWMHRKVSIQSIHILFPWGLAGKGIQVDALGTADACLVYFDGAALWRHELVVSRLLLDDPVVRWRGDGMAGGAEDEAGPSVGSPGGKSSGILVRRLEVHNGTIHILGTNGISRTVEKISGSLSNLKTDGSSPRVDLALTASLGASGIPLAGGLVQARGWIGWPGRDMDLEGDAASADGLMRIRVKAVSQKNDLLVHGKIFLVGRDTDSARSEAAGVLENVVKDVLTSSQTDLEAEFSFRTRMVPFEVGPISVKGNLTTGLNSSETSGTIVQSLKAIVEQFLKEEAATLDAK